MKLPLKELLPVCALAVLCTIILSLMHKLTEERVFENIRVKKLQAITVVMTPDFNNNIYDDIKRIDYINNSGNKLSTYAYRARENGNPIGVVLMPIVATGYNGAIQLAIGILNDGTLFGIQVLTHQETDGFGDRVHQHKSNWLKNFTGESLSVTPIAQWSIKSESGKFDQLSGATITSRGIINALRNSLQLYMTERDTIFSN